MPKYVEVVLPGMEERGKHPFSIYFVYPRGEDPFILKGRSDECEEFLRNYKTPCLYRYSYWRDGTNRGSWRFSFGGAYVSKNHHHHRYDIESWDSGSNKLSFSFRRMPHGWVDKIEELYQFSMR